MADLISFLVWLPLFVLSHVYFLGLLLLVGGFLWVVVRPVAWMVLCAFGNWLGRP